MSNWATDGCKGRKEDLWLRSIIGSQRLALQDCVRVCVLFLNPRTRMASCSKVHVLSTLCSAIYCVCTEIYDTARVMTPGSNPIKFDQRDPSPFLFLCGTDPRKGLFLGIPWSTADPLVIVQNQLPPWSRAPAGDTAGTTPAHGGSPAAAPKRGQRTHICGALSRIQIGG